MRERATKSDKAFVTICLLTCVLFLFSIMLFTFARQVLVKRLGVENVFTERVLSRSRDLQQKDRAQVAWSEIYPFRDADQISAVQQNTDSRYISIMNSLTSKLSVYATDLLPGFKQDVFMANLYEEQIRWNVPGFGDKGNVMVIGDGYLTHLYREAEQTENAESLMGFRDFAAENDIDLLYIQAPFKVSKYADSGISGVLDFSNQNADELMEILDRGDVDLYDLRDVIEEEGLDHHALFYRTDHHWKTTTGLWAARKMMEYCNERYGLDADLSCLEQDRWDQVVYAEWFLGSQGKKVTLARTAPDDFVMLYPMFETKLHYRVPDKDIDTVGDFSVTYDMEQVEEKDYYGKNPYGACNHGDHPLYQIENVMTDNNKKILIIHDSFCDSVIPAVSLCVGEVDALDLRSFTGSVETFVEETKPDLIIVMYNPDQILKEIDWLSHTSTFDFR